MWKTVIPKIPKYSKTDIMFDTIRKFVFDDPQRVYNFIENLKKKRMKISSKNMVYIFDNDLDEEYFSNPGLVKKNS